MIKMLYNICTGIYKFGNNTYPRRIRRRLNLGHIFQKKSASYRLGNMVLRRTKLYLSWDALKMIYYAFSHQIMSHGLIFWGNSTHSDYIFKLQKRIIRIIMGAGIRDSWKELLKLLKILLLSSQYILYLAMFVVNNKGLFMTNSEL
jgi:hypothetical protein